MSEIIRVLLADDHPLIRAGISSTLNTETGLTVVGEAANGPETRCLCRELRPDVLLLDLYMPDSPPLETVAYLRQYCPQTKIIILTAYDDDAYVRNLTAVGVDGYILKDEAVETVVGAVKSVMEGNTWLSRSVVMKLGQRQTDLPDMMLMQALSSRERQVLALVAQGWDNQRIADELKLAEQTIRNVVSRIYSKLKVNSRSEAIVWARQRGLVET